VVKADVAELADARDLKSPSALDAIGASRLTAVNAMVPSPPAPFAESIRLCVSARIFEFRAAPQPIRAKSSTADDSNWNNDGDMILRQSDWPNEDAVIIIASDYL